MKRVRRTTPAIREHHSTSSRAADAHVDYVLLGLTLGLCAFGLLMLYDASVVVAANQYGDKFYFVKQQALYLGAGLIGLLVTSRIDYHVWKKVAPLLLLGGLGLLMAVFVPGLGITVNGAKRWLNLGVTSLQPAYLLSFALIAYLASWMDAPDKDRFSWRGGLIPFSVLLGLVLGIVVVLQKDLGTASILALTSVSVYFLAGAPLTQLFTLIIGGSLAAAGFIAVEPYRRDRLLSFLDPSQDSLGASYHIRQVLIALGSGGWLGVGLGQSRQKYSYVPETQTDSIFAILGEELGFAGAMLMAAVFAYLLWRGYSVARRAPDTFGRLLAGGIVSLLGVQIFINLFAMVALIPLTGVPLPFISYGGTSLIVLLGSIGILLNVSRQIEN